jgi:spore coat-associated protein N
VMDDLLQEMIDPAPAQYDRPRRRRLWMTVAVVGLAAVGVTSLTTSALFSDEESSGARIKTGSLDLTANTELTFSVPFDNLLPGARITAPIELDNVGSLAFEYSVRSAATAATGNLPSQLHLDLYKVADVDSCTLALVADGTRIGSSTGTWGIPDELIVGGATVGAPGNRTLNSGGAEVLCALVAFNEAADNTYQNTSADIMLTFDAIQLKFNEDQPDTSRR